MHENEIRELRKQGVRLRIREGERPKAIQAGTHPGPGQTSVLVKGSATLDEARRVYAAYARACSYSDSKLEGLRKTAGQDYLDLMDAKDRVVIEVTNG